MKKIIIIGLIIFIFPFIVNAQETDSSVHSETVTIIDDLIITETEEEINQPPQITKPKVKIINSADFSLNNEFLPFSNQSPALGANITAADLNNDGYAEILVTAGPGEKPIVKIFDHLGQFQYQFLAYDPKFQKGFKITTADLFKDGSPEIITAPNEGGSAHIRIFDNLGFLYYGFFAFDEEIYSGASVAVADVNGDYQQEIIVGAGFGAEPIVKIFDPYSNYISEFYAYDSSYKGGVNVLTADLDNNGIAEIITAPYIGYKPEVKVFDYIGNTLSSFLAYAPGFWGGVNLASADIDNDGLPEILTGAGFSGGAHLRIYDQEGNVKINPKLFAFDSFKGGISIAATDINNDGQTEILASTQTISPINRYESYKIIDIDLKKQTLYTIFKGIPDQEYLVSTGTWKFPTPKGNYKIYSKIPNTRMTGFYGEDDPNNYDLANVPWNMPFYKNYLIHGAYWHNNFGYRMSHGCVNVSVENAKKIYDWADIGIPVNIY